MNDVEIALLAGGVSVAIFWRARKQPALGWIALAPLGFAMASSGPLAALSGAVVGAFISAPAVTSPLLRKLLPLSVLPPAVVWAGISGMVGSFLHLHDAGWLALLLPATAVIASLPLHALGAPRWVSNPLACTQEPWLTVVQTARVGGDLTTTALLAEASAAVVLALPTRAQSPSIAVVSTTIVVLAVGLAAVGLEHARRRVGRAPRVRVAAVVVDGRQRAVGIRGGHWPIESPDYRDVAGTVARYAPHIQQAVDEDAKLIVLPEVAVYVEDEPSRKAWIDAVSEWASANQVTVVAPFFDASVPRNTLCVVDPSGAVSTYDKQHPGRGLEPPRTSRMAPGPHGPARDWALSTVICVDLDYGDLVAPVRRAGGLLCAPSNDWLDGFEELHHRTAVWAAACTGATVVRATGHGISAVLDGTGRVLARASSESGPVVLVVDAPVDSPA